MKKLLAFLLVSLAFTWATDLIATGEYIRTANYLLGLLWGITCKMAWKVSKLLSIGWVMGGLVSVTYVFSMDVLIMYHPIEIAGNFLLAMIAGLFIERLFIEPWK